MTAESQPRHPLALLADYLEARQVYEEAFDVDPLPSENHIEDAAVRFVIAEQALHAIDPAALRAQAEAEANGERTYRLALLGLQRQDTGCWCYTLTGGHAPECLQARAALAQAQAGAGSEGQGEGA